MTMTSSGRFLGLLLTLASAGCVDSSGSATGIGTPVTCEWFAGDNCWKTTAAEANACIESGTTGTLSSDWLTCSYENGTQISFGTSPATSMADDYLWDFDITTAGRSCASYVDFGNNTGFSLETASGEFREDIVGGQMNISCPNGQQFTMPALGALSCLTQGLPGTAWSNSESFASFSFMSTADQRPLFNCSAAQ